jgi:hypothetical protein
VEDSDEERAAWLVMDWIPRCDYARLAYNRNAELLMVSDLDRLLTEPASVVTTWLGILSPSPTRTGSSSRGR